MKTERNIKFFLVNRNTGEKVDWDKSFGRKLPDYLFFKNGDFLKVGQVVELMELVQNEQEYFGIIYRVDELKVLQRGLLESFGFKYLD